MEETLRTLHAMAEDMGTPEVSRGGWVSKAGDCLFYYHEDVPYWRDRVDELLTLYRADDNSRIIGLQIKGLKLLPEHDLMHIMVKRGELEIITMLLFTFEKAKEKTDPDRAERYWDALRTFGRGVPAAELLTK